MPTCENESGANYPARQQWEQQILIKLLDASQRLPAGVHVSIAPLPEPLIATPGAVAR